MKLFFYTVTCLLASVVLMAQDTEIRDLDKFEGVSASSGIDVVLKSGPSHRATISVYQGDMEAVVTKVEGGVLKIGYKDKQAWRMWGNGKKKVMVVVEHQGLNYIKASSGSDVSSDEVFQTTDMELKASSGADVDVIVDAKYVTSRASSGGDIRIEGRCLEFDGDASSGGSIRARNMKSVSASAEASSGGNISIHADEKLVADVSSGGNVRYSGNPHNRSISKSSAGSVRKY